MLEGISTLAEIPYDFPEDFPISCLNATIPVGVSCNWTKFFGVFNWMSETNQSNHVDTTVISKKFDNETVSIAIDYIAQLGFTTYELDPWPETNPLSLVHVPDLTRDISYLNFPTPPSWTFAAWGVDWTNGHVPHNRSIAMLWHSIMDNARPEAEDYLHGYNEKTFGNTARAMLLTPVYQTLSLAEWTTNSTMRYNDSSEIMLEARIYVWAYGFDSKTARLGGAVAIAGCIVACVQFVAGLSQRRRRRTLAQVLRAALAYQSHGNMQERSPFRVTDAEGEVGGLQFALRPAR
ncbi:hypothetical protein CB0940_05166 [Cercospora beticola]|uniref:Uncharacterized protein n=1 Tax=Cercospora beticola TaxID=122368 RepID=A0A2G5HKH7_CERBT|nr:hypothetical protein CB0940_05166 [Cercospora beticola]PIA92712.1 hypothetical protein CB0940_05166 [Cercospora beticola]WPB02478.1 hypothetical protein RHO25_007114 [Cercospora beticola]CAK1362630.1 unnamed protein product [Cercospora beticola]